MPGNKGSETWKSRQDGLRHLDPSRSLAQVLRGDCGGRRGGQQIVACAVASWRRRGDMSGLVEEREVSRMALPMEDRQTPRRLAGGGLPRL
jgi:hypothetical protein